MLDIIRSASSAAEDFSQQPNIMTQWEQYQQSLIRYPRLGFSIDFSRMNAPSDYASGLSEEIARANQDREQIEAGEIANPDENRRVGHYWLRNPSLAPPAEGDWIREVKKKVIDFASKIHKGRIHAPNGNSFRHVLLVGIGGSALGPQLVDKALRQVDSPIDLYFLDNTDPGGMDDVFDRLGDGLAETLVLVISKSGDTDETKNGMFETEAKYDSLGFDFSKHAVAVTGPESTLDKYALENQWLERFEMSNWVGGRTSVMSAVGLLPAALTGIDIDQFLNGASDFDEKTRNPDPEKNASLQLALMWYFAGDGRGTKDMVIIPYCDRLDLMSKYLQQLVMESLGKEFELGNEKQVNQGIAVYGNKGSTDQHAYVQQLRDGLNNFFVTFIEIQKTRDGESIPVDGLSTSGDFLQGFLRGTRDALFDKDRQSITISFEQLTPYSLGALIALYERAVSFYASLVNINAYHQPGVQAGKLAAREYLDIMTTIKNHLSETGFSGVSAREMAETIGVGDIEKVYHCLNHLAGSGFCSRKIGSSPGDDRFVV